MIPPREMYGITEIARALGVRPATVHAWRKRGSHGIPEPDEELAMGPVWFGDTIAEWLFRMRRERGMTYQVSSAPEAYEYCTEDEARAVAEKIAEEIRELFGVHAEIVPTFEVEHRKIPKHLADQIKGMVDVWWYEWAREAVPGRKWGGVQKTAAYE